MFYGPFIRRIGVIAVLVLVAGCSGPLSAADCVTHWNESGPHADVAAERFAIAEISAGDNKAGQWGCGLLFHTGPGKPWRDYVAIVEGGVAGHWDSQGGSSWGNDSPEGPIQATVRVRADGTLALG